MSYLRNEKSNIAAAVVVLLVCLFVFSADNFKFWTALDERMSLASLKGFGYAVAMLSIHLVILSGFILLLGFRRMLKPVLVLVLITSALLGYFNFELGVIFDEEMFRNIFETVKDRNNQEATELISKSLIMHVFIFGIIPSLVVVLIPIKPQAMWASIRSRALMFLALCATCFILVMLNFQTVSFFSRENKGLRVFINPTYPLLSLKSFVQDEYLTHSDSEVTIIGADAGRKLRSTRRTIGIMVVGETARADHFSLNGYNRETNPRLQAVANLVNYSNVSSCGTSTAYSVPCMFSLLNEENYSPKKASAQTNVLDVLEANGIKNVWIDNNSSCKGVCRRIESVNLHGNADPASPYYNDGEYYDAVLLPMLEEYVNASDQDLLVTLHVLGSHGPAYHRRFPDEFARFKPYCNHNAPQDCTRQEITNAYDNTILYTDHVVAEIIDQLQELSNNADTFLVYMSDHGESLGENGVYLHGLPKFMAPTAQTHVPFFLWFSNNYIKNQKLNFSNVREKASGVYSHDNLSATLLGLMNVVTEASPKELNLLHGNQLQEFVRVDASQSKSSLIEN